MNDPFYNLYHIIVDSCINNKFNLSYATFSSLGENNPRRLVDPNYPNKTLKEEIDYLLKRKIIFHDQEPILFDNFKHEWDLQIALMNRLQTNHILSNSEINSFEKDLLINKSGWNDFYWFSNGFLSLEWYRYYRYANYLESNWEPQYTFSSYNRILKEREHRLAIAMHLFNNFKNKIILSCHTTEDHFKIKNLFINTDNDISTNLSYKIDVNDFTNSFCHIVTERIFYEKRIHLTEKTFRPIICCRPFILAASPGSLLYLKRYGFKTFDAFWSEDYDLIENHSKRLDAILEVINYLGSLSHSEMINLLSKMKSILIYNRNHFYGLFEKIITKEMFDNLNHCIVNQSSNKVPIFQTIMKNLTKAEIEFIKNSNVEYDLFCTKEDYFQQETIIKALNNEFLKSDVDENSIRSFVKRYAKHFRYHYLCLKGTS